MPQNLTHHKSTLVEVMVGAIGQKAIILTNGDNTASLDHMS